jgi:GntR family transcriptional regulator/MocR family aminotransferase
VDRGDAGARDVRVAGAAGAGAADVGASATLRAGVPTKPAFELPPAIAPFRFTPQDPPGTLQLLGGVPDASLAPAALIARAYRRALRADARGLLGYCDAGGHPRLRAALATMLSATRGLAAGPEHVLPTHGSQMGLFLVAQLLVRPGDVVAVEDPGYRPAWEAFRRAGARLVAVPVDGEGLQVSQLAALAERERVRAVYLTPHHHYPTTVTLSPGRRIALMQLARSTRMAVIEDDYDHEFHYEGRPVLPLASTDAAGSVIYVGTLSKVLAPGLRIGYVVAPPPVVERLVVLRSTLDLQGDPAIEAAVAELLEDGEVQRHVRRVRKIYHAAPRRAGGGAARAARGGGRVRGAAGRDGDVAARGGGARRRGVGARGLARGVRFNAGRRFMFDERRSPCVRVGFAALDERKLREAVRRMVQARADLGRGSRCGVVGLGRRVAGPGRSRGEATRGLGELDHERRDRCGC